MATRPGIFTVGVVDKLGIVGTAPVMVEIDDSKTLSQVITDLSLYAGKVAALSQGVTTYSKVTVKLETGNDTSTALGDIEKTAVFNFANASDAYAQAAIIPDVNPSILNVDGKIDLTNADVTAFVTFMTSVHTAITVVTKGVRALTALIDALISFRKHRKPLTRKTKEL